MWKPEVHEGQTATGKKGYKHPQPSLKDNREGSNVIKTEGDVNFKEGGILV